MTIAPTPVTTDDVTIKELLQNPALFTVTSRFLDIALSTINRLPDGEKTEGITELEFELFKLSRSIPVQARRAAWEYKGEG